MFARFSDQLISHFRQTLNIHFNKTKKKKEYIYIFFFINISEVRVNRQRMDDLWMLRVEGGADVGGRGRCLELTITALTTASKSRREIELNFHCL